MKKIKAVLVVLLILTMILPMKVNAISDIFTQVSENGYYEYNATSDGYYSSRGDILTPDYYVFAGSKTLQEANALINDLGIIENLQEWGASIHVVTPISETYGQADLEQLESVIKSAPIKNVKLIGIDEGATFINNYVSTKSNYVAGILLIGGDIDETVNSDIAVPTYISNGNENVIKFYQNRNNIDETKTTDQYTMYYNSQNTLEAVAVSNRQETYSEAFSNAWKSIFSQNFRYHNSRTEFYNVPSLNDRIDTLSLEYDLVQTPVFDELNIIYNEKVHQKVTNLPGNDYAWFEYIPVDVLNSANGTVPLVVTLHGNQNDPRLQGDSTGWVELAAKEKFMVVSPEYQTADQNAFFTQPGNENIYGTVDGLGVDGVINLIEDLKRVYPQIDATRIYVTGLSQGGALTSLLGIKYSNVFAAAASVSGVNAYHEQIDELTQNYQGNETAYLYLCGDHDFFQMIPVDGTSQNGTSDLYGSSVWAEDENVHIYSMLQAYQKINNLEVTEMDMSKNSYYGIALENQQWTKLGDKDMLEGTLSNDKGVVMKLAAIKDLAHWNYKAEAEYIWNFFKNYQRNTTTGELIYMNSSQNPEQDPNNQQPSDVTNNHVDKVNAVKTSDNANILLYTSMITLSMVVLVICRLKKRRLS